MNKAAFTVTSYFPLSLTVTFFVNKSTEVIVNDEIQFSGLVLEYCKSIRCLPKQLLFPLNKLNSGCVGGGGGEFVEKGKNTFTLRKI